MRLVCSRTNLMDGINIVQKAVSTKTTLPILEGILLEASNEFKLTGNDLEIGIECFVAADIQNTGSIVLNSKMLGDIVRRLPDSEVLIQVKENNLVIIECENSHFELKGLPSAGFPALPSIVKQNSFNISQKIVRDMIKQTIFAISVDENRPILTGTLIECKSRELTFVSIDGFRLALRKFSIDNEIADFNHPDCTHSPLVQREFGVQGVCEPVSLIKAGIKSRLILKKTAYNGVTVAIAVSTD